VNEPSKKGGAGTESEPVLELFPEEEETEE